MPDTVLSSQTRFPEGTSVAAYPEANWRPDQRNPSGAPLGDPDETQDVTAGALTYTTLDPGRYYAYAEVDSQHRYVAFTATQAAGNPAIPDGSIYDIDVADDAAIAQSKVADLVDDLAAAGGIPEPDFEDDGYVLTINADDEELDWQPGLAEDDVMLKENYDTLGAVVVGDGTNPVGLGASPVEGWVLGADSTAPQGVGWGPAVPALIQINPHVLMGAVLGAGVWTTGIQALQVGSALTVSDGVVDSMIYWDVLLGMGTWQLDLIGATGPDGGIVEIEVAGAIDTWDQYAAAPAYNVHKAVSGIVLTAPSTAAVSLKMETKNGLSSAFAGRVSHISLRKTA